MFIGVLTGGAGAQSYEKPALSLCSRTHPELLERLGETRLAELAR